MRVIFGIGNPGIRYENTRHNAGFLLLDFFAQKKSLSFKETMGDYFKAQGKIGDQEYVLIKPSTYVNNSGIAARQVFDKYSPAIEDFLVVSDDTNLKTYVLRVRLSGSDGGHNGLSSIIFHLITDQFPRIRIGIGSNPSDVTLSEYVLSEFSKNELVEYQNTFIKGFQLIEEFIVGGSKKMLEANSTFIKTENQNNSNPSI
ncbi:MAG: pth [Ignavibacteriaceae bacterium]|nr:pth [Ignavibacteriaceae bacterium]